MRPLKILAALVLLAAPLSAQDRYSDRQLRQRLDFAISRAENQVEEAEALIAHLRLSYAEVHARIVEDSLASVPGEPPPDTTTPPPPPDTTTPPPPPSDGPAFVSTFSGSDYTDGGRWSAVAGTNHASYLQVVTDATAPGGRALRTAGTNGDSFWNVLRAQGVPTPAVGETITWRWYYRLAPGMGNQDGDYHPIDWGTNLLNSSPNFAVLKFVYFGGAWQPQIQLTGGRPWYSTAQSVLQEGTWYRFEIAFHRTGSSSWRVDYRIYDGSDLVVDTADMLGNFGSEPNNTLASLTLSNSNAGRSAMLEIGSPGVSPGGNLGRTVEAERYAAVAAFVGAPVVDVPFDARRGWD